MRRRRLPRPKVVRFSASLLPGGPEPTGAECPACGQRTAHDVGVAVGKPRTICYLCGYGNSVEIIKLRASFPVLDSRG